MALGGIIQGHDTIPVAIVRDFPLLFQTYLPGWTRNGFYNFQATASTQLASQQLKTLMHNGSHPWINNALDELLTDFGNLSEADLRVASKTERRRKGDATL